MSTPPLSTHRAAGATLDAYSLHILAILQRDARATVQQIADEVGLSATPCWKRIKDMEAAGVITGYSAQVNREHLGLNLHVVAELNLSSHSEAVVEQFERLVRATPAIVSCLATTGESDFILTIVLPGIAEYERFLHGTLFKLPGVSHVRSSIVLKEVKHQAQLPLSESTSRTSTEFPLAVKRRAPRAQSKSTGVR